MSAKQTDEVAAERDDVGIVPYVYGIGGIESVGDGSPVPHAVCFYLIISFTISSSVGCIPTRPM